MSRPMTGALLIASLGAPLAIAAPALAGQLESFSSEVRYADLDLTTPAGAARLQQRVRSAVRAGCGRPDLRDIARSQAAAQCRATTMRDAAPKVDLAIANARNGHQLAANAAIEVGTPGDR